MKYVMFYNNAPDGMAKARELFPAYRARLDDFHARGLLLMAGPLLNSTGTAIGVLTSREAAEAFIKDDPSNSTSASG